MNHLDSLIIEADGGSRGNPGPAGSGAVIIDGHTGTVIYELAKFIGIATNNVAEYMALLTAMQKVAEVAPNARVLVRMDSKLVIEQMAGRWKIKHPDMQGLARQVQSLAIGRDVQWQWIPREENSRADALANKAMDEAHDSDVEVAQRPQASVAEFNAELPSSVRAPGGVTAGLTTVVLVRHGRTHLTESKRISGRGGANPGLSELGFLDAAAAARAVADIGVRGPYAHLAPVSAIVSSPIQRTQDTAAVIAESLHLPVELLDDIAEIAFGEWDGLTNEEAKQQWPAEWQRWQGSWDYAPPSGESLQDFDRRVSAGREAIHKKYEGQTVVVVSHVMPIRSFVRAALNAGIESYWRPQIAPCSLTIIRSWADQAAELVTLNSTSHL
jgi:probable phosphoglycerate mutase